MQKDTQAVHKNSKECSKEFLRILLRKGDEGGKESPNHRNLLRNTKEGS